MTNASAPLTDDQVRKALERAEKATRGPWIADELFMEGDRCTRVSTTDGTPNYYHHCASICEAHTTEDDDETPKIGVVNAEWNAAFIAAARTDVPALARDLLACRAVLSALLRINDSPMGAIYELSRVMAEARAAVGAPTGDK